MRTYNTKDIDTLIAEKVFGYTVKVFSVGPAASVALYRPKLVNYDAVWSTVNSYSTHMSLAWEVVNHFAGTSALSEFKLQQDYEGLWQCVISGSGEVNYRGISVNQDSAPMAICLAALNALNAVPTLDID